MVIFFSVQISTRNNANTFFIPPVQFYLKDHRKNYPFKYYHVDH